MPKKNKPRGIKNQSERSLPWRNNIGYSLGNVGLAFVFSMTAMYLTYFYTDYLAIGAGMAGTLFLIARTFDALNDPIMGYLVDRTNSRWGRFRPYILFGAIPLGIFLSLCFFIPDLSLTGRIIWAFATYIPLGIFQTIVSIPWYAQTVVLTVNPAERSEIAGVSTVIFQIGTILVGAMVIPLVKIFGKDTGFFYMATVFSIFGTIALFVCFLSTKRFDRTEIYNKIAAEKAGFSDVKNRLKMASKNIPFLCVLSATLFNFIAITITQATLIYFFKYFLHLETLFAPVMGGFALTTAISAILMSMVSRKKGKRFIYLLSCFGFIAFLLIAFISLLIHGPAPTYESGFIGYLIVVFMLIAFFNGPIVALIFSLLPDTVEFGEWKHGIRSEGILYSIFTFVIKFASSVGGALTGYFLVLIKYIPNQEQTDNTLFGLLLIVFTIPALMQLLAFISILFYTLDEKTHRNIVAELASRRSE